VKFRSKFAARWSALIGVGVTAAVALSAVGFSDAAYARTGDDKVTICHRTHSVTNPYRMITVAKASINGPLAGGTGNASGDHAGRRHNGVDVNAATPPVNADYVTNYPFDSGSPVKVFKPGYAYSGPNKIWQDIIPPFKIGSTQYTGLNWTAEGRAIYYGTGSMAGYCKKMSSGAYVASERAARAADPSIPNMTDSDIRDDLREQTAEGDGTITNSTNLDSLPNNPLPPAGPKAPGTKVENLQSALDTHNNANPGSIKQAIAGVVWYDANEDGVQQNSETLANGVGIVLIDPSTGNQYIPVSQNKSAKKTPQFQLASAKNPQRTIKFATKKNGKVQYRLVTTTVTVYTDADGYFQFPSVPAGDWTVVVITPSGYSYTYDSSGTNDGSMPGTNVPEGGFGFAWAGLVLEGSSGGSGNSGSSSSGPGSSSSTDLAATGADEQGILFGGLAAAVLIAGGVTLTVLRRRTR